MTNYLRNSFNDLESFGDDFFGNIFDESLLNKNSRSMKTDIKETDNEYVLEIEMPGFSKENIQLELNKGYLTIEGTKEENNKNTKFLLNERYNQSISRTYFIGSKYHEENVKAQMNNGILTITLPKEVENKEKKYITIL